MDIGAGLQRRTTVRQRLGKVRAFVVRLYPAWQVIRAIGRAIMWFSDNIMTVAVNAALGLLALWAAMIPANQNAAKIILGNLGGQLGFSYVVANRIVHNGGTYLAIFGICAAINIAIRMEREP